MRLRRRRRDDSSGRSGPDEAAKGGPDPSPDPPAEDSPEQVSDTAEHAALAPAAPPAPGGPEAHGAPGAQGAHEDPGEPEAQAGPTAPGGPESPAGPAAPQVPLDPDSVREAGEPLIAGLERHVNGMREHSDRVAAIAYEVAVEMGHDVAEAGLIREAARLHAVGKVYLEPEFVARPRPELLAAEVEELESQYETGSRLAAGAGVPESLCVWILHAREHWDGTGPAGLQESDIPVASQIIRAACEFDAAHRGVATRLWRGEAREIGLGRVRKLVGSLFGADVVAALTNALVRFETGDASGDSEPSASEADGAAAQPSAGEDDSAASERSPGDGPGATSGQAKPPPPPTPPR